jgi:hypothetical protein
MMIMVTSILSEKLFPLVEATELATGRRMHLATTLRWCQKPKQGIVLESVMLGGRRLTSVESVRRYMESLTIAKNGSMNTPMPTPTQQERAANKSAKKLADRLKVGAK